MISNASALKVLLEKNVKKTSMIANQVSARMGGLAPTKSMILNANALKDLPEKNVKKI